MNQTHSAVHLALAGTLIASTVLYGLELEAEGPPRHTEGTYEEITEEVKLKTPDEIFGARFGDGVAVSRDIVVSGARVDSTNEFNQGSAYVYQRDPAGPHAFRFVKKLIASDGASGHLFGENIAIDGDTLVIGAWGANQAYLFERHAGGPDQWDEVKILVGDDTTPGEQFGSSVAIDGDTIVVGAQAESDPLFRSGAAYVFERNEGGLDAWGQTAKLRPSDAGTDFFFGTAVTIDGDRLAVGAGAGPGRQGYVLERSGPGAGDWSEVTILKPSGSGASFGNAISLSGNTVVVGAPDEDEGQESAAGAAYVYDRDKGGPGAWGEVKRLVIPEFDNGGQGEALGFSLVLKGDSLLASAPGGGGVSSDEGAVWIYERDAGGVDNWGAVTKLYATDGYDSDVFGVSISWDGNTVVAGASAEDGQYIDEGAAYTLLLGPTLWASGLCPGSATIGLAGGTPGELAGLAWSTERGSFVVDQGTCAGLELGLDEPQPARALPADADGEVYFPFTAPPQACGLEIQVIDLMTCEPSNVATVPGES